MKRILFTLLILGYSLMGAAQTLENDRLALIALYNSTNGAGWTNKTGWSVPGTVGDNPCSWYGITCNTPFGGVSRVHTVNLDNNNVSGPLPVEIGNLTELHILRFRNNGITSIPSTIGNLKKVYILLLDSNNITGGITPELGDMTGLKQLGLASNSLSGTIPDNLYSLQLIESIDLNNNQLTGTISPLINNHSFLEWFGVADNKLSGNFPLINGPSLPKLRSIEMYSNYYTFDTFEQNSAVASKINFNTQACIPITKSGNTLSVVPNGTLSSELFEWYDFNTGFIAATITGNASYTPTTSSTYYVVVSNLLIKDFTNRSYQLLGCRTAIALPVTWLNTTAVLNTDNTVSLNWETAAETQNKGFEIERSSNAKSFERIGFVAASEQAADVKSYSFIDKMPMSEVNYYRLKQIDNDGTFSYSRIVAAKVQAETALRVFPNPAGDYVMVESDEIIETIRLISPLGQQIKTDAPLSKSVKLSTDGLATGIYFLEISTGEYKSVKKIIKQ